MTATDLIDLMDKPATLETSGLRVAVRIVNAREVFGRLDVCVSPINGTGEAWVSSERVRVGSPGPAASDGTNETSTACVGRVDRPGERAHPVGTNE